MLFDGMSCFGTYGLIVPAKTTSPSWNRARAKSFASVSVSNVFVTRGRRLLGNEPRLCTSKVTYQTCGIPCAAEFLPKDMPARLPKQYPCSLEAIGVGLPCFKS